MRRMVIPLFVIVLVCSFSARGQRVLEAESTIVFDKSTAELSLMIDQPRSAESQSVHLEIIDETGRVLAALNAITTLRPGRRPYKFTIPTGKLTTDAGSDLAWYRLHYTVGGSSGFISLSEILKDDFELRVYAAQKAVEGEPFRIRVRTLHPLTRRSIKNVTVAASLELELKTGSPDKIRVAGKGRTNGEGITNIYLNIPDNIEIDELGKLTVTGTKGGVVRTIDEDIDDDDYDTPKSSVFLTTDKPIYQPGQEFRVRALYLDAANFVLADKELEFSIEDEDRTVLFRQTVTTSGFGIAAIAWTIPETAKLGTYRVVIEADDDLEADQLLFKVSRYDLPNFAVTAKPDKTFYLPGDNEAQIEIAAEYLFGKPVNNGKVRVVQEADRNWNWKKQEYDVDEEASVEGESDSNGKYIASFDLTAEHKALQDTEWRQFADLRFAAYLTDPLTNRTEQKRFEIRLTKEPIHIYFIRWDYQSSRLPMTAYISTFYADGTPAVCDVSVMGGYEELAKLKTNSLGAGKIEFRIPKSKAGFERKPIRIMAHDKKGRLGTYEDTIELDREGDSIQLRTDKTIYKPDEPIDIAVRSTLRTAVAYIDVVKDQNVIDTQVIHLNDGKASLSVPYQPAFKGDLIVAVYTDLNDNYWDNRLRFSKGIIYPEQQNLILKTEFSSDKFRPSENASVKFSVLDGSGRSAESALGIVVFDKAVEQRAQTDAEFGSYFGRFSSLLGYDRAFGSLTLKDLNDLDLSRDISPDTELAAEIMLAGSYYRPRVYSDDYDRSTAGSVYGDHFKAQLASIGDLIEKGVKEGNPFPTDMPSFSSLLENEKAELSSFKDPWGSNYDVRFTFAGPRAIVSFVSPGPDKKLGTDDDIEAYNTEGSYFAPLGQKIDDTILTYTAETGRFIKDRQTLLAELAKRGIDLNIARDPWGHVYQVTVEILGRNYRTTIWSLGPDGKTDLPGKGRDDFVLWTRYADYFYSSERQINEILGKEVNFKKAPFPTSEDEFIAILKKNGLDLRSIKDGYGNSVILVMEVTDRYVDQVTYDNGKRVIKPVSEKLRTFTLRGRNSDASGPYTVLTTFSNVITAMYAGYQSGDIDITSAVYTGAKGAIKGTITDPIGAVVPGVPVTAISETDEKAVYSTKTNAEGVFLIENIPAGRYRIRTEAALGFRAYQVSNIDVRSQNLTILRITLSIGGVDTVVDVTGGGVLAVDVTSSESYSIVKTKMVSSNFGFLGEQKTSTPRLREYFPETLVWQPELITDKKGKAEMTFKMADNITTWKMYVIASTKKGKIGVAEKEITAFQPFFVDLDPPKFLTEGDEIWLPSQVRNYTDKRQQVDVTMARAAWFDVLGPDKQRVDVDAGSSQNAVFGFKASTPVKDGKQRLTAIAKSDSDAIEKPVTVRPNGEEIVKTDSRIFTGDAAFDIDFPSNAMPRTQTATLKIYPNLFAHVTESVHGLLERPYGCGEQTISSTYPNLMILKFIKDDSPLTNKAHKYLQAGYERLLGYQAADGGFTYWGGKNEADIALTAYAVRFLTDAKTQITVDDEVINRAESWLIKKQRADGSWTKQYTWENAEDPGRTKLITSYVARSLAMSGTKDKLALDKALKYLADRNAEIDEPYSLALYGLASLDAGNAETAAKIAKLLEKMGIDENGGLYWKLETNTPFHGWGVAGRIETTALVLQLLIRDAAAAGGPDAERKALISKGTLFLLKNKDRYGVWLSTQATISVLDAFLAALQGQPAGGGQVIQVIANGEPIDNLKIAPEKVEPVEIDLTAKLTPANNRIEIRSSDTSAVMAQLVATHYIDWADSASASQTVNQSRALRLDYHCDKGSAAIMEDVNCVVEAERIGFRGYGMLLAEVGLPPGADVSRESLEQAVDSDWSVSHYDILPDRIILYMWSKAGGTKVNFRFKPRYAINAQTPRSIVYDYYNPDAQAIERPLRFTVK